MPEFILNRNHTLGSNGHMIGFKKGEPTWVPPECVNAAIAIGAVRADGEGVDVLGDEPKPEEQLSAEDREALLFAAFDDLIKKNDAADFDGAGKPSMDTLKREVKFALTKKERDAAWQKHREMLANKANA